MATVSREENASNQIMEPRFRFHRKRSSSRLLKKSPTVIPGRNEDANPESSHTDFLRISGFRIAAC
ncbi:hypothetical protein, partial [Nitrobacter sp. 62-13]|uniref:hypothetical protein n=1 Tax=Nitrobacter sp. 62-13 TaxID=1895797 RepID=UPI0025F84333